MDNKKVINYANPNNLLTKLKSCKRFEDFEQLFKTYSVDTQNPYFLNQLYGNTDNTCIFSDNLEKQYNTSGYTYEIAPIFSLMEHEIINLLLEKLGVGVERGDGFFCAGGSISNLYGMFLARNYFDSNIKKQGNFTKLIGFTSNHSHYSTIKNANLMGIGEDNIIKISTTNGKMNVKYLEEQIQNHSNCFFVNATAGTTVLGAFDDIVEISSICKKYNIWLHVDACFGGAMVYSANSYLLNVLKLADSISWNFHKVLGLSLQCSVFLTKHKELLKKSTYLEINYLFNDEISLNDDCYDIGRKTLFCGRKNDACKLYIQYAIHGEMYFINKMNNLETIKEHFLNEIEKDNMFKLVCYPEYLNICFWFNPTKLESNDLNTYTIKIRNKMIKRGYMMIGIHIVYDLPYFFRIVIINEIDPIKILNEIKQCSIED